jgi:uncharacterized membrane protein YbhN (UPF0104 family)
MARAALVREPRWYAIPLRVGFVTFLLTLLSFAISLLLGILGIVLLARMHRETPNLALAYRHVAFPVALFVGAVVLVSSLVMEVRHYRQSKALARMERMERRVDC